VNRANVQQLPSAWELFAGWAPDLSAAASSAATATEASPEAAAPQTTASGTKLQTGLFSHRDYAQDQASRLTKKGFAAEIAERNVGGKTYFAVLVPVTGDSNTMVIRLKEAGFESFPL
jgi:cell division protein FtsN